VSQRRQRVRSPQEHMGALSSTLGALFNGMVVALALYGVTCGQTVRFYKTFNDALPLRALVGSTWLLDTIHTVIIIYTTWHYLLGRNLADSMTKANWGIIIQIVPTEVIALIVDSFFIYRMWNLSSKNWKPLLLLVPALMSFGFSLAYVIKCFRFPMFVDGVKFPWLLGTFSTARTVVDIGVAVGMCILLRGQEHTFRRTDSLLRTLVYYTLATGLLTSLVTTVHIVTFFTMQTKMVYIGVYYVHSKVYLNSMLVALNARSRWRRKARRPLNLSELPTSNLPIHTPIQSQHPISRPHTPLPHASTSYSTHLTP